MKKRRKFDVLSFVALNALIIFAYAVHVVFNRSNSNGVSFIGLIIALVVFAIYTVSPFVGHKDVKGRLKELYRTDRLERNTWILALFGGICLLVVYLTRSLIYGQILEWRTYYDFSATGILAILLLSAFSEELYFRGYLQENLTFKFGAKPALFIQAGAFSFGHILSREFATIEFLYFLILGILLGYFKMRGKSLMVPSLSHGIFNFAVFLISS